MGAEAGPSRRTLLLHGGAYTASRILNQGVAFLLLPLYAHLLGSEGVGVVEVLNVARSVLAVLFIQGLDMAWFRLRFEVQSPAELGRFESSIVWYLLLSVVVGTGLLATFAGAIGPVLTPGVPFVPLGLVTAFTAGATMFSVLVERRLQAEQRPVGFAVWSLVRTIATVGGIVVFVALLGRGAAGKVQGEALAAALAAVVAFVLLRPGLRATFADVRRALAYGLPLVPHALAGLVNDLVDRFFLNAFLGLQAVGVYSMGYRLAGVGMVVLVAVNQAYAPVFIETMRRVEQEEARGESEAAHALRKRLASLGFLVVLVACAVAQVVTAGAREVLLLATTPAFAASFRVVGPVSAGLVAWAWYGTLSQSVIYRPATVRRLPLITIAAALANIGANLLLIPRLGMVGAAWATFLSNTVMAAGAFLLGRRALPLPYVWRRWLAVSAWTAVSLVGLGALDLVLPALGPRIGAKALFLGLSLAGTLVLSGVRLSTIRGLLPGGWGSLRS